MQNKFDPYDLTPTDEMLDKHAEPVIAKIMKNIVHAEDGNHVISIFGKALDLVIASFGSAFKRALEPVKKALSDRQVQLNEESLHLSNLENQWRLHDKLKKHPYYYYALYGVLISGAVLTFAFTYKIILPDLNIFLAFLQSVVLAGGSFFIARAFERAMNKDRFLKYLHRIGICASVATLVLIAIAKGISYHILNQSSSATLDPLDPSVTTTAATLDSIQLVVTGLLFVSLVAVDAVFGGRLLIAIKERSEANTNIVKLEKDIEESKAKKEKLEDEVSILSQKIAQIEEFDSVAESWKASRVEQLALEYAAFVGDLKSKAKNNIDNLPPSSLIKLV